MKKKLLLSLFIIVALFTITGCEKKVEIDDKITSLSGPTCTQKNSYQTLEYIADIQNDELKAIDIKTTFEYTDADKYKSTCDNNKKEEKEVNAKNIYVKYRVTCDEKKQTVSIEKIYDTEKSMAEPSIKNMLSYVYKYIKDDGKFDLEGWKESNIKDGFSCN